jgi:S1-C subfamily serine protease
MSKVAEKVILSSLVVLFCGLIALIVIVARQANTIAANELYSLKSYEDKWVEIYNYTAPSVVVVQYFAENEEVKVGTGFFLTNDGYICTCAHVVLDLEFNASATAKIIVTVNNGTDSHNNYDAQLVGFDGHGDVAILKIDNGDYSTPPVTIVTDIKENLVAYDVMVIGCIFGIDYESCAMGNIRDQKWTDPTGIHQLSCLLTSVPTSKGNSGSPIFDNVGRCLGMHQNSFQPVPTNNLFVKDEVRLTEDPVRPDFAGDVTELEQMDMMQEIDKLDMVQEIDKLDMVQEIDNMDMNQMDEMKSTETIVASMNLTQDSLTENVGSFLDLSGPSAATTSSELTSIGSTFGGGLTGRNLHAIAFAIITKHQKGVANEDDTDIKYIEKGWVGFLAKTNTPLNYIEMQQSINTGDTSRKHAISQLKDAYTGGGLIVDQIGDPKVAQQLKRGDVVIAIDGISVGPFGYQSSPGDIAHFKSPGQKVELTVYRKGTIETVPIELVPYPTELDRPYGTLQAVKLGLFGRIPGVDITGESPRSRDWIYKTAFSDVIFKKEDAKFTTEFHRLLSKPNNYEYKIIRDLWKKVKDNPNPSEKDLESYRTQLTGMQSNIDQFERDGIDASQFQKYHQSEEEFYGSQLRKIAKGLKYWLLGPLQRIELNNLNSLATGMQKFHREKKSALDTTLTWVKQIQTLVIKLCPWSIKPKATYKPKEGKLMTFTAEYLDELTQDSMDGETKVILKLQTLFKSYGFSSFEYNTFAKLQTDKGVYASKSLGGYSTTDTGSTIYTLDPRVWKQYPNAFYNPNIFFNTSAEKVNIPESLRTELNPLSNSSDMAKLQMFIQYQSETKKEFVTFAYSTDADFKENSLFASTTSGGYDKTNKDKAHFTMYALVDPISVSNFREY